MELVSNYEILIDQNESSKELDEFKAKYSVSPEEFLKINQRLVDMPIFGTDYSKSEEKPSYFPIKYRGIEGVYIVFEYMPLPPMAMKNLGIDYPRFRLYIEDGYDLNPKPTDKEMQDFVVEYYGDLHECDQIDEEKLQEKLKEQEESIATT